MTSSWGAAREQAYVTKEEPDHWEVSCGKSLARLFVF